MTGYSAKSLQDKLGFKPGMNVLVVNAPQGYSEIETAGGEPYDLIQFFVTNQVELISQLPQLVNQLAPRGMLWISWPKKASKVPTDITENTLRDIILPMGLVDIKVIAVDEVWSGLKFVRRKN